MPLTELARAVPFLLIVGVLPGLALATLVVPGWRWWERLAAAPGLSAGVAGVIGLIWHDIHVPFTAETVLPVEAALVAAAGWRARRHRAGSPPAAGSRGAGARLVVVAALGAGAVSAVILANGYHSIPVPVATDGPVHAQVAEGIVAQHSVLPVLADPAGGSWDRPRAGVEAVAALASEMGGPSAADNLLPFTVLAVLLLPLGLAALALEATGSTAIAALAPLLGMGWAFPSIAVSLGEFPYVVDSTMVAALVIAAVRALRPGELRRHLVLIASLMAAVWVVHGLEAITAVLVAAPLLAVRAWPQRRQALPRVAALAGAALAGAALVTVLTRLPALPAAPSAIQAATVTQTSQFSAQIGSAGLLDSLNAFFHFAFPSGWVMGLYVLGVVAALVERRLRWAIVANLVLLACFLDVESVGLLRRVWVAVYPWSVQDRLPAVQYWVVPMIAALGLVWVVGRIGLALSCRRALAGTMLLGAAALAAVAVDAPHDATIYSASVQQRGVVTSADISVIDRLSSRLPASSVVLTDGLDDSGQWLGILSPDIPYYDQGYIQNHPDDPRLVALQDACSDPVAAAAMLEGVSAVFVGSHDIYDPSHPWSASCIAQIPGLREVANDGGAAAFLVEPPVAGRSDNG